MTSVTYYNLPTIQIADSLHSILLTETIINDKKIDISEYFDTESNLGAEFPYQIEQVNNKKYYHFPHGSSFLSTPLVYILNTMGVRAINDGNYSIANEVEIQKILSSGITAATVVIIFLILRIFSKNTTSLLITVIFAFSTPLSSTLSRGLWAHTWLVLLLSIAIFIILRNINSKTFPNPYILATIVSWMYFVRPTASISIIAISILCLVYFKKILFRYCLTGAIWLFAFITYSLYNFEALLPSYYLASRLSSENILLAIIGNLFSPSRGLFIYSCFLIPMIYLSIKNKNIGEYKAILVISFIAIIANLLVISSFPHWWGGHSYGPRFMSDIIPWLVVISAIAIYKIEKLNKRMFAILFLTSTISIGINTWGAYSQKTIEWNIAPSNIDYDTKRLWDWKYPPFLAGIKQPPIIKTLPVIINKETNVFFNSDAAEAFIIDGWSHAEDEFRWTDAKIARIGFVLEEISPISISIKLEPFIKPFENTQNIKFYINEEYLSGYTFKSPGVQHVILNISDKNLQEKNVITIKIPLARSPASLGINEDKRELGIAVYNITFEQDNDNDNAKKTYQ